MKFKVDDITYDYNSITPIRSTSMVSRYMDFIKTHGLHEDPGDGVYREKHHIVFKHLNEETILLTHRAHCIAHWMLTRIFGDYASVCGFHNVLMESNGRPGARKRQSEVMYRVKSRMLAEVPKPPRAPISEHTRTLLKEARARRAYEWIGNEYGAKTCQGYELTSPHGETFVVENNLTKFCKEHGLDRSYVYKVAKDINKTHKGWTATPLEK